VGLAIKHGRENKAYPAAIRIMAEYAALFRPTALIRQHMRLPKCRDHGVGSKPTSGKVAGHPGAPATPSPPAHHPGARRCIGRRRGARITEILILERHQSV